MLRIEIGSRIEGNVVEMGCHQFGLDVMVQQVLAVGESKDTSAGVIAIDDGAILVRDVQASEITLEDAAISLLHHLFVLKLVLDDVCLLANSPAQNQHPPRYSERQQCKNGKYE